MQFNINKTAIVGNAGLLLDSQGGPLIDSFDDVIRFNNYIIIPPHTGVKEAYWATSLFNNIKTKDTTFKKVLCPFPIELVERYKFGKHFYDLYDIEHAPLEVFNKLKKHIPNPSTGCSFLFWVYAEYGKLPEENIFGFSFFKGVHHYFDDNTACNHNGDKEETFIKKLTKGII